MKLRDLLLTSALLLSLASTAMAQSNNDYRTAQDGPWSSATTWDRYNGTTWVAATVPPAVTHNVIRIRNTHDVTLTADTTVDQLIIESGGKLDITGANSDLRIANGSGTDVSVAGTLRLSVSTGTIAIAASASLQVANGGVYQHAQSAGTVPTATWQTGSTCQIVGVAASTTDIGGLNQTFYNLVWNMTGGSNKKVAGLANVTNDFTILGISGTLLEFTQATDRTLTIGNDFVATHASGEVSVNEGNADITINVDGDFVKDDLGTFDLNGAGGTGELNIKGGFTVSSGTFTENGSTAAWVRIIGTVDQPLYAFDQSMITNAISLEINKPSGSVQLSADFRVNGGATLKMVQGDVLAYFYKLTLGSSTSSRGTLDHTSGTIVGAFMRWFAASTTTAVLFPVGTESVYLPATMTYTTAPTTGGTITCVFRPYDPGTYGLPLDDNGMTYSTTCTDGYWILDDGNSLAGGTYSLDLVATGFSCVDDPVDLAILHRSDDVSPWTIDGTHSNGTGTTSNAVAHRTGKTSYGECGLSSGGDTPLPIELADFKLSSKDGIVNVTWRTGAEVDNEGFEVHRASIDGEDFTVLATYRTNPELKGMGTSPIGRNYGFVDDGRYGYLEVGATYRYRLVDVGTDGSRTEHREQLIRIEGAASKSRASMMTVGAPTPNPAKDVLNVLVTLAEPMSLSASVYSASGEMIHTDIDTENINAMSTDAGSRNVRVDTRDLRPGRYALLVTTPYGTSSLPFLVIR